MYEQIKGQIKEAMMARDSVRLDTLRGVVSACTNELVARGMKPSEILDDEAVLAVITRLAKQRKDSILQFTKGNRSDLVAEEQAQLAVLEAYLPTLMGVDEVCLIAEAKKSELGITDPAQKGMLISVLMKELKGKADGMVVKEVVDSLF